MQWPSLFNLITIALVVAAGIFASFLPIKLDPTSRWYTAQRWLIGAGVILMILLFSGGGGLVRGGP